MKLRTLAIAAVGMLAAGSAGAAPVMVAGWDFSQYSGGLSTDFFTSQSNTLSSNFSDLDAVQAPVVGDGSQPYGTMHLDGQFGSFNTPLDGNDPFVSDTSNGAGSIAANTTPSILFPGYVFNSDSIGNTILFGEFPSSQLDFQNNRMTAFFAPPSGNPIDVVFEADLGSLAGTEWSIRFGGQTIQGTSGIVVEFSTDGAVYTGLGTANLTTGAAAFSFNAPVASDAEVFFRLRINGDANVLAGIDNVAIYASAIPEPGTLVLLMAGLAGLGVTGRKRA